jgi:glutathione S-transferase
MALREHCERARTIANCRYNRRTSALRKIMAIDIYWGSGSPYSWRVLLALEFKRLAYESHQLQFSKQEHKSPQVLALNFRGRVPILKDGDYVVFESLAVLYYLDLKYPDPPIFGRSPEEAGVIMRVICEYQAYAEPHLNRLVEAFFFREKRGNVDELAKAMHVVASEARSIELRLAKSDWVVGESLSAADIVIFPGLKVLLRALAKPEARELATRFLPLQVNYPALARWIARVEALPGYDRTYPPHW